MQLRLATALLALLLLIASGRAAQTTTTPSPTGAEPAYLSPSAVVAAGDGKQLFIACATANRLLVYDLAAQKITRTTDVPASPLGLALSPDGTRLFVTCAAPHSTVCVVDVLSGKLLKQIETGYATVAPVCSPDGKLLYVCDRFENCVSIIDLKKQKPVARIPVLREPIAAALTPDGKTLLVSNHLPAGRADAEEVSACVSVIDTTTRKVIRHIALPNGSTTVRDVCVSPAADLACVAHTIGKFHLPTTQVERGWIANNALSFIDLKAPKLLHTVLLDNIDNGAANPWGVDWSTDGSRICATHAGTHELSVIDAPALLRKLAQPGAEPAYDLTFLVGLRERIHLGQKGPRSLVVIGSKVYIGNYFSDSLSVVDLAAENHRAKAIPLGPELPLSIVRRGEIAFNDGSLCFQGWQSCATCHSCDARVDGLNWDLLNDGLGNPKNTKSLLFAHQTPPTMALGVRANAQLAVRAGFRYILFTVPPEETAEAVDTYLESLKPGPSPLLEKGQLSKAAARGKKIFMDEKAACATCHNGNLYTDLKPYDVGTLGKLDKPGDKFYTPTLVEEWRTGPYLHDGSAATMRDVLTTTNAKDKHGKTSHLTAREIDDLVAFLLSL